MYTTKCCSISRWTTCCTTRLGRCITHYDFACSTTTTKTLDGLSSWSPTLLGCCLFCFFCLSALLFPSFFLLLLLVGVSFYCLLSPKLHLTIHLKLIATAGRRCSASGQTGLSLLTSRIELHRSKSLSFSDSMRVFVTGPGYFSPLATIVGSYPATTTDHAYAPSYGRCAVFLDLFGSLR